MQKVVCKKHKNKNYGYYFSSIYMKTVADIEIYNISYPGHQQSASNEIHFLTSSFARAELHGKFALG